MNSTDIQKKYDAICNGIALHEHLKHSNTIVANAESVFKRLIEDSQSLSGGSFTVTFSNGNQDGTVSPSIPKVPLNDDRRPEVYQALKMSMQLILHALKEENERLMKQFNDLTITND